ncbi:UDP-N-acetylglucosamine 4,6-dehydratase [Sansalvadorimonas sp. 2012CJ34-2]|uniref:UDP-N-acetylglucosamine 4,6-dehydratase n=1 Tax=Parendozoicomonas callyspongiae TaxID=2942213 RepID=A0ABT0PKW0_9GAMM|nr:UDP-N-acetylglucosamine 4,6-dehydratase [Sansalvadorimonas sp. 2012CJ34-2]MCL6272030.1 UDP-N-acetylglucosamine 4,6-dehydratase [Sansalvadorimonas sp. 2012CJ34-2]
MQDLLSLIGRSNLLFTKDIEKREDELCEIVQKSSFLVLGGAGSIGQAVTKEIFKRNPRKIHVVDISENNLVELVRDIRSTYGYISGEFKTFALDIGSIEYDVFFESDGKYDYILNLSALKHVRSEKDPFTLMRMIDVNIFNTIKTIDQAIRHNIKKYFCVSTDKAANPVNMMGASKRIMEMFLMDKSKDISISTARFANVAFSDGSLLHGFDQRLKKQQPIVAPNDVRRYFVTPKESGELCLLSCIFGDNRDIFFPQLSEDLHLISFADIAVKYLKNNGFTPYLCETEDEARKAAENLPIKGQWPCLFVKSDTTGEKDFEEFHTSDEQLDITRFENLGIVKNDPIYDKSKLDSFVKKIKEMKDNRHWVKDQIVKEFNKLIPEFGHFDTGKYLDEKM